MRAAFPGASPEEVEGWVRGMWENLGTAAWEFSLLGRMSREDYRGYVSMEGTYFLEEARRRGKGVVLFTAHYTNWEYTSPFVSLQGHPLAVIARRMKNPYVNDFITRVRSRFDIRVILHREAVRESLRWLKKGNTLGLLFDQRITDGGVTVPFLGRPAYTTTLPALLALRVGAPVLPVHCWRDDRGLHMHVDKPLDTSGYRPVEEDVVRLTARMTEVVEEWIRRRPAAWLWIHNRWKM